MNDAPPTDVFTAVGFNPSAGLELNDIAAKYFSVMQDSINEKYSRNESFFVPLRAAVGTGMDLCRPEKKEMKQFASELRQCLIMKMQEKDGIYFFPASFTTDKGITGFSIPAGFIKEKGTVFNLSDIYSKCAGFGGCGCHDEKDGNVIMKITSLKLCRVEIQEKGFYIYDECWIKTKA